MPTGRAAVWRTWIALPPPLSTLVRLFEELLLLLLLLLLLFSGGTPGAPLIGWWKR